MPKTKNKAPKSKIKYCPKCGVKLLDFMVGFGWFVCDNCGAYTDNAKDKE